MSFKEIKDEYKNSEGDPNVKAQLRQLQTELETKESDEDNGAVSNVDLLRRISQLEKFVYGKYNK